MITLKRIALTWLPPLIAAGSLVQASDALAAAPAGDAQTQAREILLGDRVAPGGQVAAGAVVLSIQLAAPAGDAALAARGLILGQGPEELPIRAQTLAQVTPLTGSRAGHTARQDAQAQARRLIHGGAV